MELRLQKYLALCGIASRRKAEEIILSGRVKVNGSVVNQLGTKIDTDFDVVLLDDKKTELEDIKRYIAYYKPCGEVSTASDEKGRKTVLDRFKDIFLERLYPVGRLDLNTEGLILLTNDGEFANALSHPKNEIEKCYLLKMEGFVNDFKLNRLEQGVMLEDGFTAPAHVELVRRNDDFTLIEISIHEGRNRQVRRMSEAVGHKPLKLKRINYGNVGLGDLRSGEFRELSSDEVKELLKLVKR